MTAAQTLLNNPAFLHGDIRIGFTPDEEIGAGTKYFDIKKFGAKFAYTVDGDTPGELNKETFSADQAVITVHGRNIHPGSAKGIMVNSIRTMADIIARMPKDIAPETTEGYEPYIHPHTVEGEESKSTLKILLRDFNTPGLKVLKGKLEKIIAEVQPLHPKAQIELKIIEQYRNMKDGLGNDPRLLDCLDEATKRAGLTPKWAPIRGGTDGSRLTEMGLPTPNIFTGGQNYHCKNEWASVMEWRKPSKRSSISCSSGLNEVNFFLPAEGAKVFTSDSSSGALAVIKCFIMKEPSHGNTRLCHQHPSGQRIQKIKRRRRVSPDHGPEPNLRRGHAMVGRLGFGDGSPFFCGGGVLRIKNRPGL